MMLSRTLFVILVELSFMRKALSQVHTINGFPQRLQFQNSNPAIFGMPLANSPPSLQPSLPPTLPQYFSGNLPNNVLMNRVTSNNNVPLKNIIYNPPFVSNDGNLQLQFQNSKPLTLGMQLGNSLPPSLPQYDRIITSNLPLNSVINNPTILSANSNHQFQNLNPTINTQLANNLPQSLPQYNPGNLLINRIIANNLPIKSVIGNPQILNAVSNLQFQNLNPTVNTQLTNNLPQSLPQYIPGNLQTNALINRIIANNIPLKPVIGNPAILSADSNLQLQLQNFKPTTYGMQLANNLPTSLPQYYDGNLLNNIQNYRLNTNNFISSADGILQDGQPKIVPPLDYNNAQNVNTKIGSIITLLNSLLNVLQNVIGLNKSVGLSNNNPNVITSNVANANGFLGDNVYLKNGIHTVTNNLPIANIPSGNVPYGSMSFGQTVPVANNVQVVKTTPGNNFVKILNQPVTQSYQNTLSGNFVKMPSSPYQVTNAANGGTFNGYASNINMPASRFDGSASNMPVTGNVVYKRVDKPVSVPLVSMNSIATLPTYNGLPVLKYTESLVKLNP